MHLDYSSVKLMELVERAYRGEVMLPDFQRNFVWSRSDIEALITSLLENMFIGTFLVQRVEPTQVPFKVIPVEGADLVNENFRAHPELLILDGQQRLTSIFYAVYSPDLPLKNTSNPYAFFLDLEALSEDRVDEAVFSWSKEWREYRSLLTSGEYDVKVLCQRRILPLTFLRDFSFFSEVWYEHYHTLFDKEVARKIWGYINNILDYKVHVLTIPLGVKPERIAVLFERVNRTGVKLSIFDLLTARLYKFVNLRTEWEKVFDEDPLVREVSGRSKKNTKIPYYVIQGIALSRDMSIKSRDLIKVDGTVINPETWREAMKILKENVLPRLFDVSEYGVPNYRWLSYPTMISILLGLFLKARRGEIKIDVDKLNKWYWSVLVLERYSGSTETKLMKDFREMVLWFGDRIEMPEVVQNLLNSLPFLRFDTRYAGSSKYKVVFNLLFRRGAWDFYERDKLKYSYKELDDHHIFPKRFLESKGVDVNKDVVLNRTLILSSTNRRISRKAPAEYLSEMIRIHGSPEEVKRILAKHFIDEEMFELLMSVRNDTPPQEIREKFNLFISMREALIKQEIEGLVGGH